MPTLMDGYPAISAHRAYALSVTLRFLEERSPFYKRLLYGDIINEDTALQVLRKLPILSRSEWQLKRSEMRTASLSDAMIGYTGGTSGSPQAYLSTPSELAAFSEIIESGERTLNLIGRSHGAEAANGYPVNTVSVPFAVSKHVEMAADIIERQIAPYDAMPPFKAVMGTLGKVSALSLFLIKRGVNIADLGVERLLITNQPSPRWRQILEERWNARVDIIYGLSELRMCNCTICESCGCYHLPPTCIGEFVDPVTLAPMASWQRIGQLVLTAFYPFVELEPRVRYRTGDLIRIADEPCPELGENGFLVLGRVEEAVSLGRDNWATPIECYRAVADIPDVARVDPPVPVPDGSESIMAEIGAPRFALEGHGEHAVMHVELRYEPSLWPTKAKEVQEEILRYLKREDIVIELHGRGALAKLCRL